ncbi:spore germination protein KA [Sporosarcina sp. NCCP-2222]|uniref:spore germination protein n=1 Tax=Sporosarcina sp. NCCP-2222 TaxID=2935073 RepID=UPI00207FCC64|nr:spore germination protein [Sporosarcina sp. NCCP-2222]GKV56585.1 spore germination protein KA [Sporosarcina sp. NCCP-2222]
MTKEPSSSRNQTKNDSLFTDDFQHNITLIYEAFSYPTNQSLKTRQFSALQGTMSGILFFLEGTVEETTVETHVMKPLYELSDKPEDGKVVDMLANSVLLTTAIREIVRLQDAVHDLLNGNCLILLENEKIAISANTASFEKRVVSEPTVENVVRGPKEAFIESMAVNQSLLRRQVKDSRLICENMTVGDVFSNEVSIMYIKGIADDKLIKEVKQKVEGIQTDVIQNLSILEQFIESRTYSLVPSTLMTERPDRATSFLLGGHILLLMNNSPYALIVPITFWSLFHTAEDQYLRWANVNFIRIISILAIFIAIFTPSIYLAASTFHVEMLPPDLLFAIAATREIVPIPVLWEIILLEFTFEILREAGIRIPSVIGPTIGIVGALILGQAAVQANLVSPIIVIVVAITGLSSFVIQDLSLNFMIRILRFLFIFIANFMGFFGIFLAVACTIAYMSSLKSFNVPFFSPLAPYFHSQRGVVFRKPVWKQALVPFFSNSRYKKKVSNPKVGSRDD